MRRPSQFFQNNEKMNEHDQEKSRRNLFGVEGQGRFAYECFLRAKPRAPSPEPGGRAYYLRAWYVVFTRSQAELEVLFICHPLLTLHIRKNVLGLGLY